MDRSAREGGRRRRVPEKCLEIPRNGQARQAVTALAGAVGREFRSRIPGLLASVCLIGMSIPAAAASEPASSATAASAPAPSATAASASVPSANAASATASSATTPSANAASATVPSATCTPGTLEFAASHMPGDLALSPDGRSLLVVDSGFLSLRDPETLEVQRYLIPQLNDWEKASFDKSGTKVRGQTIDGMHLEVDLKSGAVSRNYDDPNRGAGYSNVLGEVYSHVPGPNSDRLSGDMLANHWHEIAQSGKLQDPIEGDASAVVVDNATRSILVADTGGRLFRLEEGGQIIAQTQLVGEHIRTLQVGESEVLAITEGLEVVMMNGQLEPQRRVKPCEGMTTLTNASGLSRMYGWDYSSDMSSQVLRDHRRVPGTVVYDTRHETLIWISTDWAMGVFDLKTNRNRVVLEPTGFNGVDTAFFLDSSHLAAVTDWKLRVWDLATGKVTFERPGPYSSAVPLSDSQVLASSHEGLADVIDVAHGRVLRTLCMTQQPCPKERERLEPYVKPPADLATLSRQELALRSRETDLRRSPDGRMLAVLEFPFEGEKDGNGGAVQVSLFALPGLTRVKAGRVAFPKDVVKQAVFEFLSPTRLSVLGIDVSVPDLTVRALPVAGSSWDQLPRLEGSPFTVTSHMAGSREQPDDVVLHAPDGSELATFARAETPELSRAQARLWSFVAPSADQSRFILASRNTWMRYRFPHTFSADPAGALEVWCTPKGPLPSVPLEPPLPEVLVSDKLMEIAVSDLPRKLDSLAVQGEDALVLGEASCGGAPCQTLVRVNLEGKAFPISLPEPASPEPALPESASPDASPAVGKRRWQSVSTFPGSSAIWLEGRGAVAVKKGREPWKVIPVSTRNIVSFAAIGDNRAVLTRKLICPEDVRSAAITDIEIEKLHRDTLREVLTPETVTGQMLTVIAARGPGEGGKVTSAEEIRAKLISLAEEARQPGADVQDLIRRAGQSFGRLAQITNVSLTRGRISQEQQALEGPMFQAKPGALIGPVQMEGTDFGDRPVTRLVIVQVLEHRLEQAKPIADRKAALEKLLESRRQPRSECAELTVVAADGRLERRVVPQLKGVPRVVPLPDGLVTLEPPMLRFQAGRWQTRDPLLDTLGRTAVVGAAWIGGALAVMSPPAWRALDPLTGKVVREGNIQTRRWMGGISEPDPEPISPEPYTTNMAGFRTGEGQIVIEPFKEPGWMPERNNTLPPQIAMGARPWEIRADVLLSSSNGRVTAFFNPEVRATLRREKRFSR